MYFLEVKSNSQKEHMMTDISMALLEVLRKHGMDENVDVLREGVRLLSQRIMELEVSEKVGAARYERRDGRQTQRSSYRDRVWEARVSEMPLRISKMCTLGDGGPHRRQSAVGRGSHSTATMLSESS